MNLAWDGVKSDREITIREMLYEDPRKVIKKHGREKLRKIFLGYPDIDKRWEEVKDFFRRLVKSYTIENLNNHPTTKPPTTQPPL